MHLCSCSYADNVQTLDKLQAENQALLLKLEAYSLKKKIIEMQNFIANDKLQKEGIIFYGGNEVLPYKVDEFQFWAISLKSLI